MNTLLSSYLRILFLMACFYGCSLVGCADVPTQNGWNLNAGAENEEPAEFIRYGETPAPKEDITEPTIADTWEPTPPEEDIGGPIPTPDIVEDDLIASPDIAVEEDTNWTPPVTVCVGVTLAQPVESCPTPPLPEEEETEEETEEEPGEEEPGDEVEEETEEGGGEEEEADAGSLSYSLFADDAGTSEQEEIDPCVHKPNTCPGATFPDWSLCDFQPQSCGFEAHYPLSKFKGHVTVVALFASW